MAIADASRRPPPRGSTTTPGRPASVASRSAWRADRDDASAREVGHLVDGVQHQRAGGGHDGGPAAAVGAQALGDARLRVRVDGGRGLDQHQDLGVDRERPGQHQPLPLPAGEGAAALGHLGLQALGQRVEDVVGRGRRQRVARPPRPPTSSRSASRPEKRVAPVSETTMRSRTSRRRRWVSGTPPRRTSSSGVPRPGRAGRRARRSRRAGRRRWPAACRRGPAARLRTSYRSEPSGGDGAGVAGSTTSGVSARTVQTRRAETRPRMSLLAYSVTVRSGIIKNAE